MSAQMSIRVVISEWHKSRSDNRSPEDLLLWLIQAFWAGDLAIYPPGSETRTSRETFLEGLRTHSEESGVAVFEATPPEQEPAGEPKEFCYDLRARLVIPADARNWTPEILNRAYAILAKELSIEDYPQPFLKAFKTHHIDRDKFADLCDRKKWDCQVPGSVPGGANGVTTTRMGAGRGLQRRSLVPKNT